MNIDKKYLNIIEYIKTTLAENKVKATKLNNEFPFRIRSEHILRVFIWVNRLIDNQKYYNLNKNALLVASLFHDVGYNLSPESNEHAVNSEKIFKNFCKKSKNIPDEDFIGYLIKNHSNKDLMKKKETPLELILLMEADMLDEVGTISIIWDCMAEGTEEKQSYLKTLTRIIKNSKILLNKNPMKTVEAKKYWKEKQKIIYKFIDDLAFELGIEELDKLIE